MTNVNDDLLFDGLEIAQVKETFDSGLDVVPLTETLDTGIEIIDIKETFKPEDVEIVEEKTMEVKPMKGGRKKTAVKETLPTVEDKEIKKLKAIIDKRDAEIEDLKLSNTVILDLQNLDDRKKVVELMAEGKMLADKKGMPFILAEQKQPPYNPSKPPIHRIFLDEIKCFNKRMYYKDMVTMLDNGKREIAYTRIWCHHKGYSTYDLVTEEQVEYCAEKGYDIPMNYSHIDLSTGECHSMGLNDNEPSEALLEAEKKRQLKIYNNMNSKKTIDEEEEEIPEIVIPEQEVIQVNL